MSASGEPRMKPLGATGRMAAAFIDSKLTPLIILVSLLLGVGATLLLPREEEPQIIVPMADVMVRMPGASAREIEQRVTSPMEKLIKELQGVEYVYSTSRPGESLVIVRFLVGENPDSALVRLYNKLYSNQDKVPPGVQWPPLVKARSIDNVPILSLTLHGGGRDGFQLRQAAAQLDEQVRQVPDVSETEIIGGQRRQVRIDLVPSRLSAYRLSPQALMGALASANVESQSGHFDEANRTWLVRSGTFLGSVRDVGSVVVSVNDQRPVYLRDVATITDGPEEPRDYVFFGRGPAVSKAEAKASSSHAASQGEEEAVTITVAKRPGSNAILVAEHVVRKIEEIRPHYLPENVRIDVTRNYGETAAERSNELLEHMGIAVFSVVALMWLALGRRESGVVAIAIPVTLALTVCTFVLYHFTLNRVTFFALIFSIGILVDDAIVVVENVVRHLRMPENQGRPPTHVVLEAVDEVGNPTVLATLTVMGAILPMAFVQGLMGPYMLPIPLGASAAMLYSMLVAFAIIPWAALRILGRAPHGGHAEEKEDFLTRLYRHVMGPLIHNGWWRFAFLVGIMALLLGSMGMVANGAVVLKMLPFDNKSEFQVLLNMPEGSSLERTAAATREVARYLNTVPEVTNYQSYVGTASPYNFNGLVRHYFLRSGPSVADIQVNLLPKGERRRSSHDIARAVRPFIREIADRYEATIQVAEIPPGPPVLQTLVTEVYGPQREGQIALAREIKGLYQATPGVVDVDWYLERPQGEVRLDVDRQKAALSGIRAEDVTMALDIALGGAVAGLLHAPDAREPVPLFVRFTLAERSLRGLRSLEMPGREGPVSLSSLLAVREGQADTSIYHKNLQPVVYVIGDVSGKVDSPLYSIVDIQKGIDRLKGADGQPVGTWAIQQPTDTEHYSIKWDGEWQVTYEVFRDLGIAFAVVLVLIYALIVGWFQNFLTPLVIVSAIPFSLVGIMPGHWAFGAFFSATSMIGFIAGAGIVVRNSIILVDFIELRLGEGMPLDQAVIDAGAVRFRPMLLTAAAVVTGSIVMLADPIFQGLAISLMAGEVASLLLSRTAVPVLYYMLWRRKYETHPPARRQDEASEPRADEADGATPQAHSRAVAPALVVVGVGLAWMLASSPAPALAAPASPAPSPAATSPAPARASVAPSAPVRVVAPTASPSPAAAASPASAVAPSRAQAAAPAVGASPSAPASRVQEAASASKASPAPASTGSPSLAPGATPGAKAGLVPLRLSLDDVVKRALLNSPDIDAAGHRVTQARAGVKQAEAPGRPQVSLEGAYTYLNPTVTFAGVPVTVDQNLSAGVVIRQALLTFGRLRWSRLAAELSTRVAQSERDARRLDVALQARALYTRLLLAAQAVRIAQEQVTSQEAHLRVAGVRFDAGSAARYDGIALESSLAAARHRLLVARNGQDLARVRLLSLLGMSVDQPVEAEAPPPLPVLPTDRDGAVEGAMQGNPRMASARWAVEAARARVELVKSQNRPSLGFAAQYVHRTGTVFYPADQLNTGIELRIPVTDGGLNKAQVEEATAGVHELESRYEGARRVLRLELEEAWLDLRNAFERIEVARLAQKSSDEALRVAELRYRGGVSIQVELVDAQAAATQARLGVAEAEHGYRLAWWNWLHATAADAAPAPAAPAPGAPTVPAPFELRP